MEKGFSEKVPGFEFAPGNIARVIETMLKALNGTHEGRVLDKTADQSKIYSKSDLLNKLGLAGRRSHISQSNQDIIENLLHIGLLETTTIKTQRVYRLDPKSIVGYQINITKLKTFDKSA